MKKLTDGLFVFNFIKFYEISFRSGVFLFFFFAYNFPSYYPRLYLVALPTMTLDCLLSNIRYQVAETSWFFWLWVSQWGEVDRPSRAERSVCKCRNVSNGLAASFLESNESNTKLLHPSRPTCKLFFFTEIF